jgi:hypothetical protein
LTDDREVTRWAVGQCTPGAILFWETGFSKGVRAVRSASLKSPTEISSPQSINVPFPDFVVPYEGHVVLLAHDGASLTTLAVDFES